VVAWWELMARLVAEYRSAWARNGDWMAWNLFLAVVPLALAVALFRPGRHRGAMWWAGFVTFVAFLPNAPYVATDVVHLVRKVEAGADVRHLLAVELPLYAVLIALGLAAYVVALKALRRYLTAAGRADLRAPVELGLHAASAFGVYLGRVQRLNSWQIVTEPRRVLAATAATVDVFALSCIAVMFGLLVVAATTAHVLHVGLEASWRELLRRRG
jgi:uncharacterized membrane protein